MNPAGKILVAAGDVGGARAIMPALHELEKRRRAFDLLDHGFIATEAPKHWPRVTLPPNYAALRQQLCAGHVAYVFGTSVSDTVPLRIARQAHANGLPVICVLDNWMNYRKRLETDGLPMLVPDVYAVMDELALAEAVADGVPPGCLHLVGQPALSNLADDYLACPVSVSRDEALRRSGWGTPGKKLVVFISEPAEKDQGADEHSPQFRGYTEKTVLALLARCLQPFRDKVQVGLVPHPREDAAALLAHWEKCRGRLQGGRLAVETGRKAVFIADGVCGMASLLLYEALLLGKPVLDLQPGLRVPQLEFLRKKGVELFVTDERNTPEYVARWVKELTTAKPPVDGGGFHPEMNVHRHSPSALADLLEQVCRETPGAEKQ
jgi:hypothetical protein